MTAILAGVDTGGTFTDLVLFQEGKLRVHKVFSTPHDPSQAILEGLQELGALPRLRTLVHGSTVATNAVLEGKGARTGLITTAGFRDVLEIGRQTRPSLYNLRVQKVPPLVPRARRVEVVERLDERGEVLIPLDEGSLEEALATLEREEVEAVAVVLLFSFANPAHERRVAEAARQRGWYVSASAEVLPEFREYERTSTLVLNAYVGPLIDRYLGQLEQALPAGTGLRIMQSNGGSISSAMARREAARTLLSGPAAGVVGARFVARASGIERLIALDIGGTSTDVSLVDGAITETTDGRIGGHPTKLPMIDIHTVGAGGGSLAWFDLGGALRVGPRSAGAVPGPAAYGRGGTEATVTDAHVVLGRLLPEAFLGGSRRLDIALARQAVGRIAERLGTSLEEAALGIVRIANANMEAAIRLISVERGLDPRHFTLVAFGGAGPLHACELAASLSIPRVLIPAAPGVLSALGMLVADVLKDYVRTLMLPIDQEQAQAAIEGALAALEEQGRADLLAEGFAAEQIQIERYLDLRYVGQSYELTIPYGGDCARAAQQFHLAHERRFGYSDPNEPVQVVNVRLKARGLVEPPVLERQPLQPEAVVQPLERRQVIFAGEAGPLAHEAAIYERSALVPGVQFVGPAIVTQYDTTTVVPPGWRARVDAVGNLLIELASDGPTDAQQLQQQRRQPAQAAQAQLAEEGSHVW
ncbi:hydantoinase/oxoprolinase family protein [Thermogemmatispora tikiterensis]|uniref:5-oxoprolinase n=1 Tax=Thermogemmatispora tikiterensis TaxID=1825093 RepID=A0A328VNJ5_9CHLR|nr:hydantoinase/oxoprolinase family protein [Thermogemmatispora tikiterensis]RAQ98451.1 5-oxoprolinase [Thermogemmatispora tikiterensis]